MFVTCGGRFLRSKRCEQQGNTSSIRLPPRACHDQVKKNIHMSESPGKSRSSELTQTRRLYCVLLLFIFVAQAAMTTYRCQSTQESLQCQTHEANRITVHKTNPLTKEALPIVLVGACRTHSGQRINAQDFQMRSLIHANGGRRGGGGPKKT